MLNRAVLLSILLWMSYPVYSLDENPQPQEDRQGLGLVITGNQELPKSLMIVPWKNPQAGDLMGRNFKSLLEEPEKALDRDVYLRELRYESVKSVAQ